MGTIFPSLFPVSPPTLLAHYRDHLSRLCESTRAPLEQCPVLDLASGLGKNIPPPARFPNQAAQDWSSTDLGR